MLVVCSHPLHSDCSRARFVAGSAALCGTQVGKSELCTSIRELGVEVDDEAELDALFGELDMDGTLELGRACHNSSNQLVQYPRPSSRL